MMSKPAYLSVEIVTDKPTSGMISVTQVVYVAEQTGLFLNLVENPVFMSTCLCIKCLLSADFYINFF